MTPRQRIAAYGLGAAVSLIATFEGYRQRAYLDPVGIPTICFGYTAGVKMGDYRTENECRQLLDVEVLRAYDGVKRCIHVPLKPHQAGAFTSLAYNIGTGAFCKSTLVRKANAGDMRGACAQLDRWVYARGTKLKGLIRRRAAERAMCEGRAA